MFHFCSMNVSLLGKGTKVKTCGYVEFKAELSRLGRNLTFGAAAFLTIR
jgi:hypothetical protein